MEFPNLHQFKEFALDTETTGLNVYNREHKAFGISISTPDGKDYYWDIRLEPEILPILHRELRHYKGLVVFANAPFDFCALRNVGVDTYLILDEERFRDVIGRACLINEHLMSYSLDYLAEKYIGLGKVDVLTPLHEHFGGRKTRNLLMSRLHEAPFEIVCPYAKRDTRATLDLYYWQQKEIARQGIESIVEFEETVTPAIIGMIDHGVAVNPQAAELAMAEMTPHINLLQQMVDRLSGGTNVNVNSSPQIKAIFDPKLGDDDQWYAKGGILVPKTKTGKGPSLDKDVLRGMDTELSRSILELRSLLRTRDTFLGGHVLGNQVNGRVYPTINQNKGEDGGTGTGRLSISSPALQQIPARNKSIAEIVKSVFIPDHGQKWYESDLSSFEVRMFGHLVNNPQINAQFAKNPETDFHQYVADLVGIVRNAEYSGQANAKQLNLSMIFNQGEGTTCAKMGFPTEPQSFETMENGKKKVINYLAPGAEGKEVIETYHRAVPGIRELASDAKKVALGRGYVKTAHGRRLRFGGREKRFAYKASGLLIQANSADYNKTFVRDIYKACRAVGGRLLLNTHDSYSKSLPADISRSDLLEIQNIVNKQDKLNLPLILEINHPGSTWWESYSAKRML